MTHHDLVETVAELLQESPDELRNAGIASELNLQGWLSARNLRLVPADPREPEISPGFWIAEHHDGRCVVMFDESPYAASAPVDVSPAELRRALVLVPLDPKGVPDRHRPLHRPAAVRTVLASPATHRRRPTAADGPPRRPPRRHPHLRRRAGRRRHTARPRAAPSMTAMDITIHSTFARLRPARHMEVLRNG